MKKPFILLLTALFAITNAAHAYDVSISQSGNASVTSSHTSADGGQVVTLLVAPPEPLEGSYTFNYNVGGSSQLTIYETSDIILNGEGTTLEGWIRQGESRTQWGITDGNAFATSYDPISMSQTCTLTSLGFSEEQLDASPTFTASVDMWVYSSGAYVASAVVTMLDASGNELSSVTVADDCEAHDWQTYTKTFTLVSGTRQLRYTLKGQSKDYWAGYYGPRFRNVAVQTDSQPAGRSADTHCLRFVMPAENVTVRANYEPNDPDVPMPGTDSNYLGWWVAYRRSFPGNGTVDDPYRIATAAQLAQVAWDVQTGITYEGKTFVLADDIDLKKEIDGVRLRWFPVGCQLIKSFPFKGRFYGRKSWGSDASNRRYVIRNLRVERDGSSSSGTDVISILMYQRGVFGYVEDAILRDIEVAGAEVVNKASGGDIGLLCGRYGRTKDGNHLPGISNCKVQGKFTFGDNTFNYDGGNFGGVVGTFTNNAGRGYAAIEQCTSDVEIEVNVYSGSTFGGIVGNLKNSTVSDCAAHVNITATNSENQKDQFGGIVGESNGDFNTHSMIHACTATGCMAVNAGTSESYMNWAGGIVGNLEKTYVNSCVSLMSMSGSASMGGIVGLADSNTQENQVEGNVFAGHIDGTASRLCAGIVGKINSPTENCVSGNLMTGTIKTGSNTYKCFAVVGSLNGGDPLEGVASCYYDTSLCGSPALPATSYPHPTVLGRTTDVLTSGSQTDTPFLPSDAACGFTLAKGYYPQVSVTHWMQQAFGDTEYAAFMANRASDIADELGSTLPVASWLDNLTDDGAVRPSLYKTDAWLASLPVTMQTGDFAFDLVSTVTGKQQMGMWTEHAFNPATQQWEEKDVRLTNSVSIPRDATCIKVEGLTATAVQQGDFDITLAANGHERPIHFDITSLGAIWDGTMATGFQTGDGSATNPYIIRSPQELAYAVNNSEEDKYYRQICDLWLNERVIRETSDISVPYRNSDPEYNRKWYANTTWRGHYDGTGHIVNGMYHYGVGTLGNTYGLFGTISASASVETLGVANSWIKFNTQDSNIETMCMGMIAGRCDGKVHGCLTCGVIDAYTPNNSFRCVGGIVGRLTSSGLIEDCVEAVAMRYDSFVAGSFADRRLSQGTVRHCLALAPIIYSYFEAPEYEKDCHYPRGYRFMAEEGYEHEYTDDDLATLNEAFGGSELWQTEEGYYPMLKAFAGSTIGKMMTLTFSPDEGDSMMGFQRQITFNPGSLTWQASGDPSYVEFDADMGVVTPRMTVSNYEWDYFNFLMGWSADKKNLLVIGAYPNSSDIQPGITFEDDNARLACLAAFDKNKDGILTLAEVKAVTNEQTLTAFQTSTAQKIKTFPEFRYFKAVTELTTQLSQMKSLESIELPYALQTVGSDAFQGCSSLKEVTLPAKVSTVSEHPFYGSVVENVYVDKFNEDFQSRDGLLFDMTGRLVSYPNGRTGSATLSGDISEIAAGAIYKLTDCDSIFIDAPNYWDVTYLNEGGIESKGGSLPEIYVKDATYDQTLLDAYLSDDSWWDFIEAGRMHRYYPLTVTSAKAATMYIGFDTQLPNGLKPYIVKTTDEDEGIAYLTQLTDSRNKKTTQVPMLTPVVIFAEAAGLYKLFPTDEELDPFPMWKNLLIGSDRDGLPVYQEDAARGNILTLGHNSQGTLGFFYYKGEQIPPYRAYLTSNDIAAVRAFSVELGLDDTPTVIHTPAVTQDNANTIYNLSGQRISSSHLSKGIYIINGKKVLIK